MNNELIDLHVHSCYSDGEYTPSELIIMAKEKGITTMAITDHDNILGIQTLLNSNTNFDIELISGIELSARVDVGKMHILGYNFDINNYALNTKLKQIKSISINSFINIYNQIKKDYNISFSIEEIDCLINRIGNVGRPHLARLCVKYGYASNGQEAFDLYLNPAYQKTRLVNKGLPPEECINIINNAGGIAVLAHPHTLALNYKEELILMKKLISYGLGGIEVIHSNNSVEERKYLMNIVNQYNLLYSGGSDYHGLHTKPEVKLGTGKDNNTLIKRLSIVDKIKR